MNILIVKLSSLGDVVHTMPAVQDIRRALPHAQIDWVVEPGFAPLVQRCAGVRQVIPCAIRQWRKRWWTASTRAAWQAFRAQLGQVQYDAVIDCQGLTKSALVARCAQLSSTGKRYAMAHRTDGSGFEAPTRWLADVAITLPTRVHAVQRARLLCAQVLGYPVPFYLEQYGLLSHTGTAQAATKTVAFIHGSSRADKCWSETHWVQLGQQLLSTGYAIALLHGSDEEEARSQRLAQVLRQVTPTDLGTAAAQSNGVQIWPRLSLDALTDQLGQCAGAIGVDSGLSHMAVALDLPHVQIYNFDTAWRTGPVDLPRQRSVYAQPQPSVAQVWDAWCRVQAAVPQ